jgi:hypothetical protein
MIDKLYTEDVSTITKRGLEQQFKKFLVFNLDKFSDHYDRYFNFNYKLHMYQQIFGDSDE